MKHDEVVAALKVIANKGMAAGISKADLQELRSYTLIEIAKGEEHAKSPACILTKKGRVMLKANTQKPETDTPDSTAD